MNEEQIKNALIWLLLPIIFLIITLLFLFWPKKNWDVFDLASHGTPQQILQAIYEGADFDVERGDETPLINAVKDNPDYKVTKIILENSSEYGFIVTGLRRFSSEHILNIAARYGRYETVKYLLKVGCEADELSNNGMNALMIAAAFSNSPDTVKIIAEHVNIDYQNNKGCTALMYAAMYSTPEIIQALLTSGANIQVKDNDENYAFDYALQNKVLRENIPLLKDLSNFSINISQKNVYMLAKYGRPEQIQRAINAKISFKPSKKNKYNTLHEAASHNLYPESIELILSQGLNINSTCFESIYINKWTPLMYAAFYNPNPEITRCLLEHGANIASAAPTSSGICTALSLSVQANLNPAITEILFKAEKKETQEAILNGTFQYGYLGEFNLQTFEHSAPLLNFAADYNNLDAVKFLLKLGANVNSQSTNGRTPLMCAARYSSSEIVKILLKYGADVNIHEKLSGKTALIYAINSGSSEKVKLILEAGADISKNNSIALLEAEQLLHSYLSVESLQNYYEIFDMLTQAGADVNVKKNGDTLLVKVLNDFNYGHHENETISAIIKSNIIKMLVNAGADINAKDEEGRYPFELTTEPYLKEILKPNNREEN